MECPRLQWQGPRFSDVLEGIDRHLPAKINSIRQKKPNLSESTVGCRAEAWCDSKKSRFREKAEKRVYKKQEMGLYNTITNNPLLPRDSDVRQELELAVMQGQVSHALHSVREREERLVLTNAPLFTVVFNDGDVKLLSLWPRDVDLQQSVSDYVPHTAPDQSHIVARDDGELTGHADSMMVLCPGIATSCSLCYRD